MSERKLIDVISNAKLSEKCESASKKVKTMLGFLARNLEKTPKIILSPFNSQIEPGLELAVQFWSPTTRTSNWLRVRRAAKLIQH